MNGKFAKRVFSVFGGLVLMLTMSGCYFSSEVQSSQVGIRMSDGVKVDEVVGSGRYDDMGFHSKMVIIDISAKTFKWSDPDLVTKDKQPIAVNISVTVARKGDKESILKLWNTYRSEAQDDNALQNQVLARIPSAAKTVTVKYTLDEMLGIGLDATTVANTEISVEANTAGREIVTQQIADILGPQLDEFGVQLLDIRIENVQPDQKYLDLLKEKANASVEVEVARAKSKQLEEQLVQEKKQTDIEVEKASRQNKVNQEQNAIFEKSDKAYELERLRLIKDAIKPGDKIYFIPQGTDITVIVGGSPMVPGVQTPTP